MGRIRATRIALLSGQQLFLDATVSLLRDHHLGVVHPYRTLAALLAHEPAPDILVIDLDHQRDDVMDLVAAGRRALTATRVVVVGTSQRQGAAGPSLGGAVETPDAGVARLLAALAGRASPPSAEVLLRRRQWARITPRQRDALRWIVVGFDNREIARKLGIGERAVKAHVSLLLSALAVHNRTQLALVGREGGVRPRSSL